ncbi:MAG: amino acid ABC transporter permease [Pseudanabaenaceae cyanobacterium]|jgi:general L-amino acid transport system permease protein
MSQPNPPSPKHALLMRSDQQTLWQIVWQLLFVAAIIAGGILLWNSMVRNMRQSGLAMSFDFLQDPASFDLPETPIPYSPTDSYAKALGIGLLNTLKVVATSLVGASAVGLTVGIARLSPNWLLRSLAQVYVEILRNTPLLLQLFFWYGVIFLSVGSGSSPNDWLNITKEGITLVPLKMTFTSEFCALVMGLTLFSSAFIAEIVRGGILAVSKGQWEAAQALGLSRAQVMRLVVLPQSLRTMIPPLTSQYVNIAKNSSLAVAVGYRDVYAIASTTINQTGRPINVILLLMAVYLTLSLSIAFVMNWINRRVQIVER